MKTLKGELKFSPDGDFVAMAHGPFVDLYRKIGDENGFELVTEPCTLKDNDE